MYPAIDKDKCIKCFVCVNVCPYDVFEERDGIVIVSHPEECIECGECVRNCEQEAISLTE